MKRIIPCLLLENGGLVKTKQFGAPTYIGDPVNAVKIFAEKGADELVLLDITTSKEGREPDFALIEEIAGESFMPLAYGGGIRDCESIRKIIRSGVEKVIINSATASNIQLISDAADMVGSQSVVAAIDVKKPLIGDYRCFSHSGSQKLADDPIILARKLEAAGAGEIMINNISRDGMMTGYDIALIEMLRQAVSVPLIVCGGAGQISDLYAAFNAGADGAAAGSLFVFHGKHKAVLISCASYFDDKPA